VAVALISDGELQSTRRATARREGGTARQTTPAAAAAALLLTAPTVDASAPAARADVETDG